MGQLGNHLGGDFRFKTLPRNTLPSIGQSIHASPFMKVHHFRLARLPEESSSPGIADPTVKKVWVARFFEFRSITSHNVDP